MMSATEKERRKFLDECDVVAKVPMTWFLEGTRYDFNCLALPLPIYVYVGARTGMEAFELEMHDASPEAHSGLRDDETVFMQPVAEGRLHNWKLAVPTFRVRMWAGEPGILAHKLLKPFTADHSQLVREAKFKIWIETPLHAYGTVRLGLVLVLYSLANELDPGAFNPTLEKFRQAVRKHGGFAVSNGRRYAEAKTIRAIVTAALAWFPRANCATTFCGLMGSEKGYRLSKGYAVEGFDYAQQPPDVAALDFTESGGAPDLTQVLPLDLPLERVRAFCEHIRDPLERIKVSVVPDVLRGSDLLLAGCEGGSQALFSPVLAPLFTEGVPDFVLSVKEREFPLANGAPLTDPTQALRVRHVSDYLEVVAPSDVLQNVEAVIETSGQGWIYYGHSLGPRFAGEHFVEGARLLEDDEFRLATEFKVTRGPEREVAELPTLELGIGATGPYVKVAGQRLEGLEGPKLDERFFAYLALLAAARKKKRKHGWVPKDTDGAGFGLRISERDLWELRQALARVDHFRQSGVEGKRIIKSPGRTGEVRLEAFEPKMITIRKTLCEFDSVHKLRLERLLGRDKWDDTDQRNYDQRCIPAARSVTLVRTAVELLGWEFHDKDWREHWGDLISQMTARGRDTDRVVSVDEWRHGGGTTDGDI